jgi:phosphoribosylglycinamide formyltransferase-1
MVARIAVCISGNGSNLQALIDKCPLNGEISLVIANKANAYGLQRAEKSAIPTAIINHQDYDTREDFDAQINQTLINNGIDYVCLAGFMRILTPVLTDSWHNKMLNIHPSLLPAFKGVNTHQRAIDCGVMFHGCTVHFVRSEVDVGPIIKQDIVKVTADDTATSLANKVHAKEHIIYPIALDGLINNKFYIQDEKVIWHKQN